MKRFTRMISLVLVLCMVFSLLPMVSAAEKYDEIGAGKTVILHSNDVHGEVKGYAYMAALKTKLENELSNSKRLLLHRVEQHTRAVGGNTHRDTGEASSGTNIKEVPRSLTEGLQY